jgi:hypothetical protein
MQIHWKSNWSRLAGLFLFLAFSTMSVLALPDKDKGKSSSGKSSENSHASASHESHAHSSPSASHSSPAPSYGSSSHASGAGSSHHERSAEHTSSNPGSYGSHDRSANSNGNGNYKPDRGHDHSANSNGNGNYKPDRGHDREAHNPPATHVEDRERDRGNHDARGYHDDRGNHDDHGYHDARDNHDDHGRYADRGNSGHKENSRERAFEHRGEPEHHDRGWSAHYEPARHVTHEREWTVARDNRGHVRDVVRPGIAIHHDYHGQRHFVSERNGVRVVGYGSGRGFTERRYYASGPRVYVQRTYIYGGRPYAVAYRSYRWRGVVYYHYAPAYYYHPVFYGWAYRPWIRPVYFRWGWYSDPWYPAYGYYFRPYPVYPSASLWLTDFLLAENLRLAYEARVSANAAAQYDYAEPQPVSSEQSSLSPEVKQMIADEVQRQLAAERALAEQPSPSMAQPQSQLESAPLPEEEPAALDPNQRVFIVAGNLDLATEDGECGLTAGDVLLRTGGAPDENNRIGVNVVSSKQGDCPVNTNSAVEVSDLQEMHNHFREKMDMGLKTLAEDQGKNGLPPAPESRTIAGEAPPPEPDRGAETDLRGQQSAADEAEKNLQKNGPGN